MTKQRKKPEQFSMSVKNYVIVFIVSQYVIQQCSATSEIIGSSVVTSVSVILGGEGRSYWDAYSETTTALPPLPASPDLEPADASSSTSETPAVTTVPSTASTAKVPFPIYIHAEPVRNNDENVVEETTDASSVVAAETSSPPPAIVVESLEQEPTAATPSQPPPSPSPPPVANTPSSAPSLFPLPASFGVPVKSSRRADDDGIRVIDALKDIVRQAQQQHAQNDAPVPAPVTLTLTANSISNKGYSLPSTQKDPMPFQDSPEPQKLIPGTGMNGDDDDEMEFNVNAGSLDPGAATTDVIDDFAKVVVVVQPEDNSEAENDTEAEVQNVQIQNNRVYKSDIIDEITASILCQQRADIEECGLDMLVTDAMHKISGAILSSDDDMMQRPVENIVNDVLGSLATRNASQAPPKQISTTTQPTTTTTTTRPTTTTRRTTTTTTTTTTPRPTTTTTRTTTTSTTTTPKPPTARTTTTTTTTTPRPTLPPRTTTRQTLPPRTTPRPTTTTTWRTTMAAKRQTPSTTSRPTPTTTVRTTSSTFLPRITPRVTARTTTTTTTRPAPPTTRTTTTTSTTRPPTQRTTRTTTTLRPRPPQTTESFMYGNLFNNGMDSNKTPQTTSTTIVKKDKPVMYSTDPVESDIPPPPYQGAPPVPSTKAPMSTTKAPMPSTKPTVPTTTQKPMSALENMIKQSEQMGRPFAPAMPQFVNSGDVFDPEPVEPPSQPPQQQQQQVVLLQQPQQQQQEQPTDYRIPGIPVDEDVEQSTSASGQVDENDDSADTSSGNVEADGNDNDLDNDNDQEEEEAETDTEVEFTTSTLKPYSKPPKKPINTMIDRRPINETSSSKKQNDFYDDEIFGFDPYQTFHHGVYVPVVEVIQPLEDQQADSESSEEEVYVPPPTAKPKRKRPRPSQPSSTNVRPFVKQGKPTKPRPSSTSTHKNSKKPAMPNLPDYLHRPRPSHLQYQHGAADDTDPITGLLNANYNHPGESYGPETQTFAPDRLLAIPPQALPQNVRKKLADHHDHHYQHQHGLVVPGHGHGHGDGHGSDGHGATAGGEHLSNAQVPSQASNHLQSDNAPVVAEKRPDFGPAPPGNPGLEATLTSVDPEMRSFVDINNRIALRLFSSLTNPVSKSSTSYGNMVVSKFTITSYLSMLFLGARGNTASQLDGLLRLDDMLTFNPHMMYHNITQAFLSQPNTAAAMIRLLIADKGKGGILDFYRTRVQHFYDARVEQADYKFAGHLAQSIINQMIRAQIQRHSYELLNYSIPLSCPMSLLTATFFDGQFAGMRDPKVDGMNFIHLAALGRRLFPVPALSVKRNFRAAYDNDLDATAVEIPYTSRDLSLIVMMPGKPGEFSIGGVASLKSKLTLESWTQLMRGFYPRDSFKVVLPRFRHQTAVNLTYTLKRFGLTDLFMSEQAQFKGINGLVDLHVDENMMHFTEFATWEKLSDTMRENTMQNNKNLDLIRILRPYVKDQYGQYSEPLSVNDWISMSRRPAQNEQRSRGPPPQPQSMDIRLALRLAHAEEKMKRRQTANGARSNTNPRLEPMRPFMRTKGKRSKSSRSTSGRRHHNKHSRRQERDTKLFARQTESNVIEIEKRVLKFERPFIYVLRHNPTGMILMTGQYTEPVTEVLE